MSAPSPNLQRRMNNTGNIIPVHKDLIPGLYNKYPGDYLDIDIYNNLMINKPWIESSVVATQKLRQSLQQQVVTGGDKILVICVDFSDKPSSVSISAINNRLFGTTGNTLRSYYSEMSNGLYVPDGIVIGWYRAPHTYAYYRDSPGCNYGRGTYPNNVTKLCEDILDLINNDQSITIATLSGLDIDGDGHLLRVIVVHAGGEAANDVDCNEIWCHTNITSPREVKGKIFNSFAVVSEYVDTPTDVQASGPDCHEFGHLLGLQDLYDNSGNSIVGLWSLMSTGMWGVAQDGTVPTHLDAWSKSLLGWTTVHTNQLGTISVGNIENYYVVYMYTTPNPGEYFMIENRQTIPGKGLLIWHINENKDQSSDVNCRKVSLIQADNRRDLENNINPGDSDDPYPGGTNNRLYNGTSSPNSLMCDGTNQYLEISNISDSAAIMSMTASFTRGNVVLRSIPSGARIWIDDIDQLYYTPKEIVGIPLGTHAYTLRLTGYQDLTGNFTIVESITTEVSVTLTINASNTTDVSFSSIPSGARIWIDSVDKGVDTPHTISGLIKGSTHTYRLTLTGYQDVTGTLTLGSADTTIVSTITLVTNASNTGNVYFTSVPSGARIWIDDTEQPYYTPKLMTNIPLGIHTYIFRLTGYQQATGAFTISHESTTADISRTLEEQVNYPEVAYFTSVPSGARIWIDNLDTGLNTPDYISVTVNVGHTFRLTLAGYQDFSGTFSVSPGWSYNPPTVNLVEIGAQENPNALDMIFHLALPFGVILGIDKLISNMKKQRPTLKANLEKYGL